MARFSIVLTSTLLVIFSQLAFANIDITLKGADGSLVKAKVTSNNHVTTETGGALPDGLYIRPDMGTVKVIQGKVVSNKPAPKSQQQAPLPQTHSAQAQNSPSIPPSTTEPSTPPVINKFDPKAEPAGIYQIKPLQAKTPINSKASEPELVKPIQLEMPVAPKKP